MNRKPIIVKPPKRTAEQKIEDANRLRRLAELAWEANRDQGRLLTERQIDELVRQRRGG